MVEAGDVQMIPVRSILLNKVLRSSWTVAAASLTLASLLEWGLIVQSGADVMQITVDELNAP